MMDVQRGRRGRAGDERHALISLTLLSPLVTPPLERKRETSFNGTSVISVVADNVKHSVSADQYIGLYLSPAILFSLFPCTPPPLASLGVVFVVPLILFPSPLHPCLSSVHPLWRGPVMSAPSLSLHLPCRTRGSRRGGPALRSAVQQTGASWVGRSVAQRGRGSGGGGMRGCLLGRIERQWRGHF